MKATQFNLSRTAGLLVGALLVLVSGRAAEADALPSFDNNYVKLSVGGASVDGSKAAFQARTQQAKSGVAGIEAFNYTYDVSKDTALQIDGRVLGNTADYLAQFKLTKNEVGSLEVGYKRFRTFYDGSGGFFPGNNAWLPIYRQPVFVDRGKFFINGTIELPKAPVFTFKYSNETRTGNKPSTIWGDSDLTGIPIIAGSGAVNPFSANRKILPARIALAERNETWEIGMKQVVGNTTAVLTVAGDKIDNNDWRTVDRYVGELKPYPALSPNPKAQVPNSLTQSPQRGLDGQAFREHGYTVGGRVETVVNDQITVFAGLSYHSAKEGINASRLIYGDLMTGTGLISLPGSYSNGGRPPYSYTSAGNLKQEILTGNIGVQAKPMPDLYVEAALKGEAEKDSGYNDAIYYANNVVLATGVITPITLPAHQDYKNNEKPWTPGVDVRYTGIKNVALYGSWEYRTLTQDERSNYGAFNVTTSGANAGALTIVNSLNYDKIKEKHGNASIGINWTPVSLFSGRAEVFTKDHENRFDGYGPSLGGYYYLNYDITGVKLTGVVKPAPILAFTTRYIVQRGKASITNDIPTTVIASGQGSGQSNNAHRYQLSETVDFNPNKNVYAQLNASIVYDQIITAYPFVTGTAQEVIRNSSNNYVNGDAIIGFAASKEADIQLQGTYYKTNNGDFARAYATQPTGADGEETTITVGLKYKLAAKTVLTTKVGYIDSKNNLSGGFTDFRGPLAYVAIEHAF